MIFQHFHAISNLQEIDIFRTRLQSAGYTVTYPRIEEDFILHTDRVLIVGVNFFRHFGEPLYPLDLMSDKTHSIRLTESTVCNVARVIAKFKDCQRIIEALAGRDDIEINGNPIQFDPTFREFDRNEPEPVEPNFSFEVYFEKWDSVLELIPDDIQPKFCFTFQRSYA